MSTGTLKLIEHSVPDFGAEPMATAMHAKLAVELQDLRSCLPEMPAVALYYSGGQFHAFWPEQLPASVRSRVREHLEMHHLLGDLQTCEGLYWAEDFDAGRARLHHLDAAADIDIEPRTIRRCLEVRLGDELSAVFSQPQAMEKLAAIAERESIDIAVVCALAARRWPYPATVSVPGETPWSNASELAAGDEPERFSFLQHQFGDVHFSLVVPAPAPEALLTIEPELDSLPELDPSGKAQEPDFLNLESLFDTSEVGIEELSDLEILFAEPQAITGAPDQAELEDEALSLEALFGTDFEETEAFPPFEVVEQPVVDAADEPLLLESLFAVTEPETQRSESTPVESMALFDEVLLPTEPEEPYDTSIEMLFAEDDSTVFEPIADASAEVAVELENEVPSLEMLFGDFSEEVWSEPTPEVTVAASEELNTDDLETLFAEAASEELATSTLEALFAEVSDEELATSADETPAVVAPDDNLVTSDLETLFAEVSNEELVTSDFETLLAEVSDEELDTSDFETLFAGMDFDLPMVQEFSSELVEALQDEPALKLGDEAELTTPLLTDLEVLFAEPETVENELANLEHCVAILGEAGTGLFAGVIAFATRLDWITDAPMTEAIAAIEPRLDRMHCRMLHCPQPGETVEALTLALTTVPDNLQIKVGMGLPTGHSLYALSDAAGRRLFFHQQPGSEEPVLVHSWSGAADASQQLDWRAERFELLWSDRLRPHVQVEALKVNREPLLALS